MIDAPDLAQRVANLAHRGLGAQRLPERDEHVLRPRGCLPEVIDPALPLTGVPRTAQPREPLRLDLDDGSATMPKPVPAAFPGSSIGRAFDC